MAHSCTNNVTALSSPVVSSSASHGQGKNMDPPVLGIKALGEKLGSIILKFDEGFPYFVPFVLFKI